ncbi:MAG: D-TA family PLP-dependent enzyme [Treponema sp.]|jgi:D-serine deaminase-like pyridoxal phosphate-dependent protein|nr:D-TA family PLP-dependent enzyme [Treponema sp.]
MDKELYVLTDTEDLISPALIYYEDIIIKNTRRIIETAGGADRLWPHIKTHKTAELVRMQIGLGISRFKCATVAEAELCARAGAGELLLAYPLVGPNIRRYTRLAAAYPQTVFYALGDDFDQLKILSGEAAAQGLRMNILIDADLGMRRTGVPPEEIEGLYEKCAALPGLVMKGLHGYDGHFHHRDLAERAAAVAEADRQILAVQEALVRRGFDCGILIMGGSPTFPCRAGQAAAVKRYLSPGTIFIGDWGYYSNFPDLAYTPGAAVFSRVVSHPAPGCFTLDLGYKAVAADQPGKRGIIAGLEDAEPLGHSEEHWVFRAGKELPAIGEACYVIPTHICPTTALYGEIQIARNGGIAETWQVTARNRRLTY